ncbi:MAG: flagellar hook-basal body complex protein FliE [Pseudomonadota bacterium]
MDKIAIEQVMQQMRATATRLDKVHTQAGPREIGPGENTTSAPFSDVLADAAKAVSATQKAAGAGAAAVEAGVPGVALDEVMVQMQRADLSFRAMTEVRNKLVSAYQDIMNMPV